MFVSVFPAVDGFVKVAHDHFNFSNEQALGILFWFNYDISKALAELKNYSPFEGEPFLSSATYVIECNMFIWFIMLHFELPTDEWTVEDKVIFEQAYQKYGKNFQRIRSMVSGLLLYTYVCWSEYALYKLHSIFCLITYVRMYIC